MSKILLALSSYQHLTDESCRSRLLSRWESILRSLTVALIALGLALVRSLTQALSNLLTGNEAVAAELIEKYTKSAYDSNMLA